MILALEAADSWRLTCSECTDALQKRRGCKKPGANFELQGPPFRFSSPVLQKTSMAILYECPTGYLLREAPYVYNVIDAVRRDDNLSPALRDHMSVYYHHAARLYQSERVRLLQLADVKRKASGDAAYGQRVLKGR